MRDSGLNEVTYRDIPERNLIDSEMKTENNRSLFQKRELKNTFLSKCDICSREKISEQDRNSFYKQEYLTVKTKEELILYRVASEIEGRDAMGKIHKGRFASPDQPFDKLSAKTDLALAYPFGNRMEVVEEIKVPIGEILQVGYVAPKTTGGKEVTFQLGEQGSILPGMSIQVILPDGWQEREGWKILNRYALESRSQYGKWEEIVEKSLDKDVDRKNKKSVK